MTATIEPVRDGHDALDGAVARLTGVIDRLCHEIELRDPGLAELVLRDSRTWSDQETDRYRSACRAAEGVVIQALLSSLAGRARRVATDPCDREQPPGDRLTKNTNGSVPPEPNVN